MGRNDRCMLSTSPRSPGIRHPWQASLPLSPRSQREDSRRQRLSVMLTNGKHRRAKRSSAQPTPVSGIRSPFPLRGSASPGDASLRFSMTGVGSDRWRRRATRDRALQDLGPVDAGSTADREDSGAEREHRSADHRRKRECHQSRLLPAAVGGQCRELEFASSGNRIESFR